MDGVIVLNKPKDFTSNDCVVKLKGILKERKIGHTGTLDPNVTGVLPICIGKYTKLSEILMADRKTYIAEIVFGIKTETEDIWGAPIEESPINYVDESKLDTVLTSFIGKYSQTPPMYSAIKHNGKKLYEYARKGIEIERIPRNVFIYSIKKLGSIKYANDKALVTIEVDCSKGTYIRTLATDIGRKMNLLSAMGEMSRTKSGIFTLENSHTLEDITNKHYELLKIEDLFPNNPRIDVSEYMAKMVRNGIQLDERQIITEVPFLVFYQDELIALYQGNKKHVYSPIIIL